MKCRVRIVIVSVVVGFILEYNHYYSHPYSGLNYPNPSLGEVKSIYWPKTFRNFCDSMLFALYHTTIPRKMSVISVN